MRGRPWRRRPVLAGIRTAERLGIGAGLGGASVTGEAYGERRFQYLGRMSSTVDPCRWKAGDGYPGVKARDWGGVF
jgi:hypothetical protein